MFIYIQKLLHYKKTQKAIVEDHNLYWLLVKEICSDVKQWLQ